MSGKQDPAVRAFGPQRTQKRFVLCFDGTGNKFSGTPADSNILKIFRMLDCADPNQMVYYQPGIGTYVESASYSHTSIFTRVYSQIQKTRDAMIGSSFDQHLMAGYKFLMRYYSAGDDIYMFGFSRGSYTARFLAEMLDMVGLLPAGNEEMARFAFKAFANWQRRLDGTAEEKAKKRQMFEYLTAFRETFSRPVRRIRFLGLFDTVNSVPRFENAWLKRSKFPYTAKSSAVVIRHAVAIDERRAKFRQDLIGEARKKSEHPQVKPPRLLMNGGSGNRIRRVEKTVERHHEEIPPFQRFRSTSRTPAHFGLHDDRQRSRSPGQSPGARREVDDAGSFARSVSQTSLLPPRAVDEDDEEDEARKQDIQEYWFPGCHADIGGGWPLGEDEQFPLSHTPLVWMTREAQRAGLPLVREQMLKLRVIDDEDVVYPEFCESVALPPSDLHIPEVRVTGATGSPGQARGSALSVEPTNVSVKETLRLSATRAIMHDCLIFGQGLPATSVLSWKLMEWLPFARMDLQSDNSWRAIRWPLPRGEVRDIPNGAWIHITALRRMEANPDYRPGNLILGGGGRGLRRAPQKCGTGEWTVCREEGDPIGECVVRKRRGGVDKE